MNRYDHLLQLIDLFQPQSIIEIGTWNGANGIRMIQRAQQYNPVVSYVGYDLFEDATSETDAVEFNVKQHNSVEEILNKMSTACPNADINLIKGNTRATLNKISADFVFIDGGHSVETITGDYMAVLGSNVIVFDDFYVPDSQGLCPDTSVVGCNSIVATIPHRILPCKDPVKGGGFTQLVMVGG